MNADASRLALCWSAFQKAVRWVVYYVCAIQYLNPVYLIQEKQKKLYHFDQFGKIVIQPKLSERIFNLFSSDNVRRRRILTWVQQTLPSHNVEDFSFSWNDGIVLCALLEAVHPGICPSFGHLKPHNRVNNCRLGLKLAQQCYGLPLEMISPEEMAIASYSIEPKLLRYVSMIKWAAESGQIRRRDHDEKNEQARKMTSFSIKGSGIVSGIVGRKARFSISAADVLGMFHLGVDIKGPKNEIWCHSQANAAVSVTIHGPRPFSVLESSVIYTGDSLYEVTYDVAYPGYYVICIKYGEEEIAESPFLARVTYEHSN
uniref:Filamin-C n=1 Tax=Magallana gigas TaxID=29159 RepID=K1RFR0_MAGGI